jgi:hypothetical protein
MLEDPKHGIKSLNLPKGGCVQDQTFTDNIALYLKGTHNMSRIRTLLDLICRTSGAKVNWGKSAAIWANKKESEWEWGQDVGFKWIPEREGVHYLGIQIRFWLPTK